MITINARIALLSLLPLIAVIMLSRAASTHAERYREASRRATSRVNGMLNEVLTAVQAVKVGNANEHVAAPHRHAGTETAAGDGPRPHAEPDALRDVRGGGDVEHRYDPDPRRRHDPHEAFTLGDFALFVTCLDSFTMLIVEAGGFTTRFKQVGGGISAPLALIRNDPSEISKGRGDGDVGRTPTPLPPGGTAGDHLPGAKRGRPSGHPGGAGAHLPLCDPGQWAAPPGIEDVSFSVHRGRLRRDHRARIGSGKTTLLRTLLGLLPAEQRHPVVERRPRRRIRRPSSSRRTAPIRPRSPTSSARPSGTTS